MKTAAKAIIDQHGKIDYEVIKAEIIELGPLRFRRSSSPYELIINISPCACASKACDHDVISISRVCGLSEISWQIEKSYLLSFECLEEFFQYCQIEGPISSLRERRIIEQEIFDFLGYSYTEVDSPFCACSECAAKNGKTALWKNHLLRILAIHLKDFDEIQVIEEDESDGEVKEDESSWMEVFDQGYALGRLVGEYHLKSRVEELAEKGIAAEVAIQIRTTASGKSSSEKRQLRILQMLEKMEDLVEKNPVLLRIGIDEIADLAIQDASSASPDLWSQGQGRKDEYLDEIKSDHNYQARFQAIMKTA